MTHGSYHSHVPLSATHTAVGVGGGKTVVQLDSSLVRAEYTSSFVQLYSLLHSGSQDTHDGTSVENTHSSSLSAHSPSGPGGGLSMMGQDG